MELACIYGFATHSKFLFSYAAIQISPFTLLACSISLNPKAAAKDIGFPKIMMYSMLVVRLTGSLETVLGTGTCAQYIAMLRFRAILRLVLILKNRTTVAQKHSSSASLAKPR